MPVKGLASYYSIEVDGQVNKDAAWYYPTAKENKTLRVMWRFERGKVEA